MSTENLLGGKVLDENHQLCYGPSSDLIDDQSQDFLIFMITGNPGLIKYYEEFLSHLHDRLSDSSTSRLARFYICGSSLKGFDDSESEMGGKPAALVGLEDQIDYTERLLFQQIKHREATAPKEKPPKVILMGHSVGAYILLELIRRHPEAVGKYRSDFDLIGGILLFPTITHLAKSPKGMMYSRILGIPHFPDIAGSFVNFLFALVPTIIIYSIIKLVMRFPEHAAKTSADFIKSAGGVRQALYLAKDEMDTITDDKWPGEVWGAATTPGTDHRDTANSNLVFYWGENVSDPFEKANESGVISRQDKYVANKTRDDLIKAKGHLSSIEHRSLSKDWKPSMFIDKDGIPHAFCLSESHIASLGPWADAALRKDHSKAVAEKVQAWVELIVERHPIESS
ncbi:hypothetical protein MMC22_006158 [Lobaria immixta]|nr:hypothetical protein [Lobaria immixta]